MTTLNQMLNTSKYHKKENCSKTKGRRLYIRDYEYNKKRKKIQVFKSWGITCLTCGLIIRQQGVSLGLENTGENHWLSRQEKRRNLRTREKFNKQFAEFENVLKKANPDPKFHKRLDKVINRRKERLK